MLADADGRWLGARNAALFCAHAERLAASAPGVEIVLDLEPPIDALRGTVAGGSPGLHLLPPSAGAAAFRAAHERVASLVARLSASGAAVSAAVALPVLLDRPGRPVWQELLGTPADGIGWAHVSAMLYTSILEGWSRGMLRRADVRAILAWSCREAALRFGPIAGASLGAVGTGAFGDEPTYRDPGELADDVALARAAGLDDLALFDLGGALRRPPVEAWLVPFVSAEPAPRLPEPGLRARAAIAAARASGVVLGWRDGARRGR
jgi:hypothetical protein